MSAKSSKTFNWGPEQEKSLEKLKKESSTPPVLVYANYDTNYDAPCWAPNVIGEKNSSPFVQLSIEWGQLSCYVCILPPTKQACTARQYKCVLYLILLVY